MIRRIVLGRLRVSWFEGSIWPPNFYHHKGWLLDIGRLTVTWTEQR